MRYMPLCQASASLLRCAAFDTMRRQRNRLFFVFFFAFRRHYFARRRVMILRRFARGRRYFLRRRRHPTLIIFDSFFEFFAASDEFHAEFFSFLSFLHHRHTPPRIRLAGFRYASFFDISIFIDYRRQPFLPHFRCPLRARPETRAQQKNGPAAPRRSPSAACCTLMSSIRRAPRCSTDAMPLPEAARGRPTPPAAVRPPNADY